MTLDEIEAGLNKAMKRWFGEMPTECQLCGSALTAGFVDGRTRMGPWANMCLPCHKEQGGMLGTGMGQQYDAQGVKVGG